MELDVGVRGRNECVVAVLKHSDGEAICENLGCGVDVAQNGVTAPPPHEAGGVWVHPRHEEQPSPLMHREIDH